MEGVSSRSARALVAILALLRVRIASADHGAAATTPWSLEVWLFIAGGVVVLLLAGWAWLAPEREERGKGGRDVGPQ